MGAAIIQSPPKMPHSSHFCHLPTWENKTGLDRQLSRCPKISCTTCANQSAWQFVCRFRIVQVIFRQSLSDWNLIYSWRWCVDADYAYLAKKCKAINSPIGELDQIYQSKLNDHPHLFGFHLPVAE